MRKLDVVVDTVGWLIGAYLAAGAVTWCRAVRNLPKALP